MQAGCGRTGTVWAIEQLGVEPDLLVSGKTLGGGLPLAAVTGRAELMDAVHVGGLGGTFGGNPVACAAALAVLDGLTAPGFAERADRVGTHLRTRLEEIAARQPLVGEVRGLGPMLALELARADARRRQGHDRGRVREGAAPAVLRPRRERDPAPAAADGDATRSSNAGSTCWRRHLATLAPSAPETEPVEDAPAVRLSGIRRVYGDVVAVAGIDLDIAAGEFFTLLGPSGSGKTTTLRVIAGFERPDAGHVELQGVDVTRVAPSQRAVNTVFQDYALFPHMTVAENVEYGLRVKGMSRRDRRARAQDVLERVRLPGVGDRKPVQLSGGQRQRVALARAIVNGPPVLLLDEPLGALDLKLRQEMQTFLKALQRDLGITFVYVTHDQEEALTMSDRLAVFNEGKIEQVGAPADVYEHPQTAFVAGFVGVSNILERAGRTITIRPEKIRMSDEGAGEGEPGAVREVVYVGMVTRFVVDLDAGGQLVVVRQNLETSSQEALSEQGKRVRLSWRPEHTYEIQKEGT